MQRRTVMGIGMAGLVVGVMPWAWASSMDEANMAYHQLAIARGQALLHDLTFRPTLAEMARRQTLQMEASRTTTHCDMHGSDPVVRARQVGYAGSVLGEVLAETWDGPVETVKPWLAHDLTREVLIESAQGQLKQNFDCQTELDRSVREHRRPTGAAVMRREPDHVLVQPDQQ